MSWRNAKVSGDFEVIKDVESNTIIQPPIHEQQDVDDSKLQQQQQQQHQAVMDSVREDMLGEEPDSRFKTIFYRIDPFQGEQMIRAPKHFRTANIYFGFLYWGVIILFAVMAFYQHFTRYRLILNVPSICMHVRMYTWMHVCVCIYFSFFC